MFDNFGLGEFFFLALLALLFFGPERLPQIGARLGRWVGNLTQYSKAFMTEWREEALAIHDAVEEVKGIRDEIVAAQREISGTLDTAREDMVDGLDAAKEAVSDATTDVRTRIQQQRVRAVQDFDQLGEGESGTDSSASVSGASGTDAAISRTQQVLADLGKSRAASVAAAPPEGTAAEVVAPEAVTPEATDGDEAVGAAAGAQAGDSEAAAMTPGDEEWERTRRAIEEGMKPKRPTEEAEAGEPAAQGAAAAVPGSARTAASSDPTTQASPAQGDAVPEKAPEPPRESAFDRTQQVLENLRKRRAGVPEESLSAPEAAQVDTEPAPEAEAESTPPPPKETAFDRTQQVLQNLKKKRQTRVEETAEVQLPSVNRDDFARLSNEVLQLREQMEALRNEMRALQALASQANAAADDVSIEEVA
jgi:Sec-independent protein translocase protein TatA